MKAYGTENDRCYRSDVAYGEGWNGSPSRLFKVKSKNRKAGRRLLAKAGRRASKAACAEGS